MNRRQTLEMVDVRNEQSDASLRRARLGERRRRRVDEMVVAEDAFVQILKNGPLAEWESAEALLP